MIGRRWYMYVGVLLVSCQVARSGISRDRAARLRKELPDSVGAAAAVVQRPLTAVAASSFRRAIGAM